MISCLYRGVVAHHRLRPVEHRLRYRVFQVLIDLDEEDAVNAASRLVGFNRPALLAFYERDHGDGSGVRLKAQIEAKAAAAGYATGGPVRVLCMPRVLGLVFNPISIWFVHDRNGALSAILYEVNNTFGDRTAYVLPASRTHSTPKAMHVSPLMEMEHRYDFDLIAPAETVALRIGVLRGAERFLTASFTGRRAPLSTKAILRTWLSDPLLPLKVVAGIHWEALRTWAKGVRYRSKPHGVMSLS